MTRLTCALLLLCTLAMACSDAPSREELTLTITSDLQVPAELDRVTVSVAGQVADEDPEADLRERPLPRTLTLVHQGGPLGPFAILVRGWLGSTLVVERELRASFDSAHDVLLTVVLDRRCAGVLCEDGETCDVGICEPIDGTSKPDAGDRDASRDAGRDASRDATVDAQTDANLDADLDASEHDAADANELDADVADAEAAAADAAPANDAGDASADAQVDASPGPGAPPVCTIVVPATGDSYQANTPIPLRGSCADPETGAISSGLVWRSQRQGMIASGAAADVPLQVVAAHRITLCAPDPRGGNVEGCTSADIDISAGVQPTVSIGMITQGGSTMPPYSAGAALTFTGVATGAGVSLSWSDDVQGALGNGSLVTMGAPVVGRHTVTLTVQDRNGVQRSVTRNYVVVAAGERTLVSALPNVNAELDRAGNIRIDAIGSDPSSRAYVPSSSGVLYRFDGNALSATASVAVGEPPLPDVVQDIQVVADRNLTYLATAEGYTVCSYAPAGGTSDACTSYLRSGLLQNQDFRSILRMVDARDMEVLLVGSADGVFLPEAVTGNARGTTLLRGRVISDIAPLAGRAALASNQGVYLLTIANQTTERIGTAQGLPSNQVRSLATGSDGSLWIATSAGLARYEPGADRVTTWNTTRGLPSNNVHAVTIQRPAQVTPPRDVVWIATAAGVARLDTLTSTVSTFTMADGLPGNEVLAVHVLANGAKLFGTNNGLARYVGY